MVKRVLVTSLVFVLAACSRTNSHDKLVEALKTTRSWTATAQMIGEAWQRGDIPDQYAQQTLIKTQQEIDKAVAELDKRPALFQRVQQSIQKIAQDIEHHDKAAISTSLQSVAAEKQQLEALAKAEGIPS